MPKMDAVPPTYNDVVQEVCYLFDLTFILNQPINPSIPVPSSPTSSSFLITTLKSSSAIQPEMQNKTKNKTDPGNFYLHNMFCITELSLNFMAFSSLPRLMILSAKL